MAKPALDSYSPSFTKPHKPIRWSHPSASAVGSGFGIEFFSTFPPSPSKNKGLLLDPNRAPFFSLDFDNPWTPVHRLNDKHHSQPADTDFLIIDDDQTFVPVRFGYMN